MKVSVFIAIALLTGWVSTSSLDTAKRLKAMERQNAAILVAIDANEIKRNADFVKMWGYMNDVSLEAQQCRRISELNLQATQKLSSLPPNNKEVITEIQSMSLQLLNTLKWLAIDLDVLNSKVPNPQPPKPPEFVPSKRIDISR